MSKKYIASLVSGYFVNNDVFNDDKSADIDDRYETFRQLKFYFKEHGIDINTEDLNVNSSNVLFELHFNARKKIKNVPAYVLLLEVPLIFANNERKNLLSEYRKVFTWNDKLVDGHRFVKICFPNKIIVDSSRGFLGRDRLCCMIAGNKSVRQVSPIELYSARVETIRWFEQHAPDDFDLYGVGWNAPAARHGLVGRIVNRLERLLLVRGEKVYFPSFRGKVASKLATLQKYRFSICYENVIEFHGYITEKIFDSFFSGCIPVYWGAPNVTDYIPPTCFIDRRNFATHDELHKFMTSMSEAEYIGYQEAIAAFLQSDQAKQFSAEVFAETIVQTIVSDLGLTA